MMHQGVSVYIDGRPIDGVRGVEIDTGPEPPPSAKPERFEVGLDMPAEDVDQLFGEIMPRRRRPTYLEINGKPLPWPYRVSGHSETHMGMRVELAAAIHCHKCTGFGAVKTRRHHRLCRRRGGRPQ